LASPRHRFLQGSNEDDFETLVKVEKTNYRPGKVATRMHMSMAQTRICRGGLGSGKTRAGGEHINHLCLTYPGALCVIARYDSTTLRETTQREFLQNVVSPETVEAFNINENKLYYKNGSAVLFKDCKDPASFKSLEITAYMIDEADENPSQDLWDKLDERLRQKIKGPDGEVIIPLYAGLLVLNPTDEEHWIYKLSKRTDISIEDFQFSTYDNEHNLPPNYISNLIRKTPAWDIPRLVHGNWGRQVKGKPVIHGFTYENHVKRLKLDENLLMLRGWDFGFRHPGCLWLQIDPRRKQIRVLREKIGTDIYLDDFAREVKAEHETVCGPSFPTMDYADPHGADKKDNALSSIETLRLHHGITCLFKRQRVKTGLDELQERVLATTPILDEYGRPTGKDEPQLLVDASCTVLIGALMGGYHRDEDGEPVKDGYFDHLMDCFRWPVVHNMNPMAAQRFQTRKSYVPKNRVTGY
jgi:hypothetical protein